MQRVAALFLVAALSFGGGLSVAQAAMDKSDTTFVTKAAAAGILEVQASQATVARAGNPDVRAFAQRMTEDHTTVDDELKTPASKKGIAVSKSLPADRRAEVDKLNVLEDARFDRAYADKVGVKAHKEAIPLFDKASKGTRDPGIKASSAHNLPALREHLQMTEQLETAAR